MAQSLPVTVAATKGGSGESLQQTPVCKDYLNVTKPGITMSNALMTFTGVWLAGHGHPSIITTLAALVGSSLVVMGGCAMNNFMDRDIDQFMARTSSRPLPNGRLQPSRVLLFGTLLSVLGVVVLMLFVNDLSALMALIGLVFYVVIYTGMTKRTTTLSTVVGSISGAVPPLIGWTAITGSLSGVAWLLFAFMFIWQSPHFLSLGMRRAKEYASAGIPLLPVVHGFGPTKQQIIVWTAALIPTSLMLYEVQATGLFYLATALILGAVYLYKALKGIRAKDDFVWATDMFKYSLIYLTVMSLAMIVNPL